MGSGIPLQVLVEHSRQPVESCKPAEKNPALRPSTLARARVKEFIVKRGEIV